MDRCVLQSLKISKTCPRTCTFYMVIIAQIDTIEVFCSDHAVNNFLAQNSQVYIGMEFARHRSLPKLVKPAIPVSRLTLTTL